MSDVSGGGSDSRRPGGPPSPDDLGVLDGPLTRLDGQLLGDGGTRSDWVGESGQQTRLDADRAGATGWTDPTRMPEFLAARFSSFRPLPAGGQALVYRARTAAGDDVVVRVARPGVALAVGDIDLERVSSPHLVRILETGAAEGIDFQILEYVSGPSVAEHLRGLGRFPEPLVRRFVAHVVDAIETLGAARLVHGDVKPDNVLMRRSEDGEPAFVVIDFGLTRMARHTVIRDAVPGTLLYFPPEGCAGYLSMMWDWWSLGMVVVELLTGSHPLEGADPQTLHLSILNRRFDLDAVTDPRWSLLVRGLLTSDHEHRWGGAQVRDWLAGGSPPVADSTTAAAAPARTLRFAGRTFVADPRRLADALGQHWDDAARMIGSPAARALLVAWARQFGDTRLLAVLDDAGRPDQSLDQVVIRVVGALYDLPREASRGACRAWYRGRQMHLDVLHGLCAEALASAEALAGTSGGPDDVVGSGPLHAVVSLVAGDLAVLADSCGRGRQLGRLNAELLAGRELLVAGTTNLDPPAEAWEHSLWAIQLLSCLTSPDAEVAMRADARRAAGRRRDLLALVAPGTGPADHLLATIRRRRIPSRWDGILRRMGHSRRGRGL